MCYFQGEKYRNKETRAGFHFPPHLRFKYIFEHLLYMQFPRVHLKCCNFFKKVAQIQFTPDNTGQDVNVIDEI